jgi:glutaconate CoA-transferase subunit A
VDLTNIAAKLMTPKEAVERFIPDGAMISLGGFTVSRNPMVIGREIIRQGRKDLHLVVHSHGQAFDLMIGAGCVTKAELAYGGLGRFAPTGIRFRKAVCSGELVVEDYSNMHMSLRFMAGALHLPYIPCKTGFESDVVKFDRFGKEFRGKGKIPNKKLILSENPFNDESEPVVLLPALNPDVTLLHAQQVGSDGTVRIKGLTFLDIEEARAADRVIVTCEEIVPAISLRADPDQNSLPHFLVDAIVPAPFGAHPTACFKYYDYDPAHLNLYRAMAADDDGFRRYLDEWVYGPKSQDDYVEKIGGACLARIKANTEVGYAVGLNRG